MLLKIHYLRLLVLERLSRISIYIGIRLSSVSCSDLRLLGPFEEVSNFIFMPIAPDVCGKYLIEMLDDRSQSLDICWRIGFGSGVNRSEQIVIIMTVDRRFQDVMNSYANAS